MTVKAAIGWKLQVLEIDSKGNRGGICKYWNLTVNACITLATVGHYMCLASVNVSHFLH